MILSNSTIESIDIENFLLDLVGGNKHEKFLLIVPTNRRVRRLKKWLIEQSPGQKTSVINLHTLKTFSEELLLNSETFRPLSDAAASVFIERILNKISLQYFNKYTGEIPYGTIEELRNVISEFKRHGITPDLLRDEALKLDKADEKKLTDIANIFDEYLKITSPLKTYETGDVYYRLTKIPEEKFHYGFRAVFPQVKFIFVIGFNEFANLELELLNKISLIEQAQLFVEFDYYKFNPAIFGSLNEYYQKLTNYGFRELKDLNAVKLKPFNATIRRNLFLNKTSKIKFDNKVLVFNAENRIDEVEKIAGEVKRLILEENLKPSNICVAFNVVQNYSYYIRDIFDSFEIPFNLTDRISLDKSLPVTALINLLSIVETNFYFKNILRAFSSSFIDIEEIDVNSLKTVARQLNIVVGQKNWRGKIRSELELIKEAPDSVDIKEPTLRRALESIEFIDRLLMPFKENLTIKEFLSELKKLVNKINLTKNVFRGSIAYQETNIKGITTFFETIEEIFNLIEEAEGKGKKYDLRFFLSRIRTAARFSRFNTKERPEYGVLITSVNEIRGLKFDYLFLGGMVDGDFPTKYRPEIFKPGKFSSDERKHLLEERYLFFQAVTSWEEKLYLSYPKQELKKDLSPSVFLIDFKKLFNIRELTELPSRNLILSGQQLFEHIDELNISDKLKRIFLNAYNIDLQIIKDKIETDNFKLNLRSSETEDKLFSNPAASDLPFVKKLEALQNRTYSISQLETYALCPFKYFVERILNVKPIKEPTEEIEPIEFGNILHNILFVFYTELSKRQIKLANCSDETFSFAEKLLFEIAETETENSALIKGLNFYEREKILGINGNRKQSILYKFLEYERNDDSGYVPAYFETTFGFDNKNGAGGNFEIGGVKLRGKIDRIEINQSENKLNVVDYKSGASSPSGNDIQNGLSLQLPVYLFAASTLTKTEANKMFIYSLKYSSQHFGKKLIFTGKNKDESSIAQKNKELFDLLKTRIPLYVKNISEGKFPLSNLPNKELKICNKCDFRAICRTDEF